MHLSLFNIFSDYNTCTCGLSVCSLCLSPLVSTEWDVSGSEGFVDLGLHPGFPHYAGAQIGWKGNSFHSFISNLHLVSIQWHIPPNNLNYPQHLLPFLSTGAVELVPHLSPCLGFWWHPHPHARHQDGRPLQAGIRPAQRLSRPAPA